MSPAVHELSARAPGAQRERVLSGKSEIGQFPSSPEPLPLARFSANGDLRAAIALWVTWLAGERRASPHTVAAYGRDLAFFLDFLTTHLGEVPTLSTFAQLSPADYRAYLAHRAAEIERTSLARGLSVVRGFVRFLERRGLASSPALSILRAPQLPQGVPQPLSVADAAELVDGPSALVPSVWQAKGDIALLTLLYGCGLRISEALGLKSSEIPRGDVITITGKGRKQRLVPVLPAVHDAIADYVAAWPYLLAAHRPPLFRARRGPLHPPGVPPPNPRL